MELQYGRLLSTRMCLVKSLAHQRYTTTSFTLAPIREKKDGNYQEYQTTNVATLEVLLALWTR
jgi:hypothetical protein